MKSVTSKPFLSLSCPFHGFSRFRNVSSAASRSTNIQRSNVIKMSSSTQISPSTYRNARIVPFGTTSLVKSTSKRYSTTNSTRKCWKCDASVPLISPTCPSCHSLQSLPNDVNYFDILNDGKIDFSLDLNNVRRRFLQLQQDVHPDGFATEGQRERLYADQWSSFINKGWQTLRENLGRAIYVLRLNGIEIGEGESIADKGLLMQVLEAREELEEATSEEEVDSIRRQYQQLIDETLDQLEKVFPNDLQKAKALTIELQYWTNIRNACIEWEPGKPIEIKH